MNTVYITDLTALLEEALHTRIEQVHLQISRNKGDYPGYQAYDSEFHAARERFEAEHPDLIRQVDEILSFESLRQDEIAREIYWQGVRDCLSMSRYLNTNGSGAETIKFP